MFVVPPLFEGVIPAARMFDYETIKDMLFAQVLEHMYEFAYEGRIDSNFESMEDETSFTFVSAVLVDALKSELLEEWIIRGSEAIKSLHSCVEVAELANARNILEGGESFFPRFGRHSDNSGGLTIRQMALLAGMEEMSIRAAANPKRANPLKTVSDAKGTHITLTDAKDWLQSKGLYVPVAYESKESSFDLKARAFANTFELYHMLRDRFDLQVQQHGTEVMRERLSQVVGMNVRKIIDIDKATMQNPLVLEKLADVLDLPVYLLQLRVAQVYAEERLRGIHDLVEEAVR